MVQGYIRFCVSFLDFASLLIVILILHSWYDIIILSEAAVAVASNLREREVAGSNPAGSF